MNMNLIERCLFEVLVGFRKALFGESLTYLSDEVVRHYVSLELILAEVRSSKSWHLLPDDYADTQGFVCGNNCTWKTTRTGNVFAVRRRLLYYWWTMRASERGKSSLD